MSILLEQRVARLERLVGQYRERIKVLRDDNRRLWQSRQEWKEAHAARGQEIQDLRRRVQRLRVSRDQWRERAVPMKPGPKPKYRGNQTGLSITQADVDRIRSIPARG